MAATITERIRPDGTKEILVKPEPAIFRLSALAGAPDSDVLSHIRAILQSGAKVTITPEARAMLEREHPEALRLLEGG